MTDSRPSPPERPVDLDVLRADDLLLDALGRGEPGPADDGVAALLAAWRAELTEAPAAAAVDGPTVVIDVPADDAPVAEVVPITRAWRRRRARLGVAAAVLAVVAGGTGIAAAQASPGSPLWPITHLVNPDRVDVLDAESAIADARKAATEGRSADAQRLVTRADVLVSRVRDRRVAARLRAELDDVRHLLATVTAPVAPSGGPSGAPAPGTVPSPGTTPTPAPGPGHGGGQPTPNPGPTGTGGGQPPPLVPSLPLPTAIPVPSLPLPTLPIPGVPH
jgi:hypothetical protein